MSGIFGCISLDGQPVDSALLNRMRDAMAFWGPDASSIWTGESVALGHLMRRSTPEDQYETLPKHDPEHGLCLTAAARLDYREELFPALGLPLHAQGTTPDGELILRAYARWGKDCVKRLDGDWTFAVWDERNRELFLSQCPSGISSIFYYQDQHRFLFASSLKAILALPEVPKRPNLLRIAQILTSWSGDGTETAYEGIQRLPPAHWLSIREGRVRIERYWFPETLDPLRLRSDHDYVEAFLNLYSSAVRTRLRTSGRIGGTLSGGLDSSSVCALAAREMKRKGERLPAFTSVPQYSIDWKIDRAFVDESPYAAATAAHAGNIDVEYIRAEKISPLAGIRRTLDILDEPGHAASNMYWICAILERARETGLSVLLTGQMGNGAVSWIGYPKNMWPMLLRGQWSAIRDSEATPWLAFRRHLAKPVAMPWRRLWRRLKTTGKDPWSNYSAIRSAFARSLSLAARMRAGDHDPWFWQRTPLEDRLNTLRLGRNIVGATWAGHGAAHGLDIRDSTMDRRLVEFCLRVPDEQYYSRGTARWLMRRAMQDLLPNSVRLNEDRGSQAADIVFRVRAGSPEISNALDVIEKSPLSREVLDLVRMRDGFRSSERIANQQVTQSCGQTLLRGLMVGLFLLRFD